MPWNATIWWCRAATIRRLICRARPSVISVTEVLETVRAAGEKRFLSPEGLPAPPAVNKVLKGMQQALAESVGGISLRELAAQQTDAAPPDQPLPASPESSVKR